ncbi:MAG TPA: hypothetical protein VGR00_09275 [Thermoanaerobaculia bacterium]|nr:hypothetical protein [Thermoanaerobaculia bacterium]
MRFRARELFPVLLFVVAPPLFAGAHTWSGGTSGDWSVGSNWSLGVAPTNGETNVSLVFPAGQGNMASMMNTLTGLNVVSITFADVAYVVTGSAVNLNGSIAVTATTGVTAVSFGLPITLTGNGTFMGSRGLILDGVISGPFGVDLTATDPGTITLTKLNTYIGGTTIHGGTIYVNGTISSVLITSTSGNQSYLRGSGTVGAISIGAGSEAKFVYPGGPTSRGILTCNGGINFTDVAAGNSGFLANALGPAPGTGYDQLVVNGPVNLNSAGGYFIMSGYMPPAGATFAFISNDAGDAITGQFISQPEGYVFWAFGPTAQLSYHGGDGNDVVATVLCPSDAGSPTVAAPVAAVVTQTTCA